MNYSDYFTNRPTDEITRDLVGRPLIYDNGKEKLGGYIVEAEAYMGKNDRAAHSYGGHRRVLPTMGFIAAEAPFIFMRRGNTSFSTLLVKKKTSLKEYLSEQSNPSGELIL
ncbi:Putative uncharacterized protein [Lactobacillus helveticus CIRM-BIA 101]|nr:DNA-3-methyladenine glycosylase [Lactobacillus helveticus]KRL39738.1 hypothetical protein FC11_GL000663 [Lactobacillus helveticus DSM 20075 = CGMCC 1.1877]GFP15603.1 hypothetical protein LHEJCM1120_12320 [Lactobacillus helveticus]CDI64609.1 Putative uncharacterized protein [Lactobacillus helveticus CIRM-BIA 101]